MRSVWIAAAALGVTLLTGCEEKPKPVIEINTPKAKVEVHRDGEAVDIKTTKKTPTAR